MKECGHHCTACQYTMTESASDIFDSLYELEDTNPEETKRVCMSQTTSQEKMLRTIYTHTSIMGITHATLAVED